MSRKYQILFSLFSPEKLEVNRFPNRRKSPHIMGCSWLQSWVKISAFFHAWGFNNVVIPHTVMKKIHWFWLNFEGNHSPLYEDLFDDLGIDWLLFFQKKTDKIKFVIFETPKWHIFNHIGSAQRRFWLYFPYYLHISKYAWKMLQIHFFCKFSKTSEKTAYLQKKVYPNPQRSSRCRYRPRKK